MAKIQFAFPFKADVHDIMTEIASMMLSRDGDERMATFCSVLKEISSKWNSDEEEYSNFFVACQDLRTQCDKVNGLRDLMSADEVKSCDKSSPLSSACKRTLPIQTLCPNLPLKASTDSRRWQALLQLTRSRLCGSWS